MARTTGRQDVAGSDESEHTESAQSSGDETSKTANKGKTTRKRVVDSEEDEDYQSASDASERNTASHPNATLSNGSAKKAAKRRLSARPDTDLLRRKSFNNLSRLRQTESSQDLLQSSQDSNQAGPAPQTPRVTSGRIAGLNRIGGRPSLGAEASVNGLLGAGTADGPGSPMAPVSKEMMNENYEEWMKMATDNKINSTNTWSFALIDYFHDMSLLRNPDNENSINFQKASSTLDGCVKIWTSRVDSVAAETGKLLSGLTEEGGVMLDDDDAEGSGSDNQGDGRRKRRKNVTAKTLVDDFSKIKNKNLDLDYAVDPLFKKTSADFDEGGASGILMNHLGCDRTMRVVFDASDSRLSQSTEDGKEPEDEDDNEDEGKQQIDISRLRAEFLPDLGAIADMVVCPSLADFKFSAADAPVFDLTNLHNRQLNENGQPDGDPMDEDGFFDATGAQFGEGDLGPENFFDAGPEDDQSDNERLPDLGASTIGPAEPFDPSRGPSERELVMVMNEGNQDGVFDYFDTNFTKNWAGPEHWKMRRAPLKKAIDNTSTAKNARKEKVPFSIDFETERQQTAKELFATSSTSTTIKQSPADLKNFHVLPDDMHFSSAQLLRLFMKPRAMINMRRRGPRVYQDEAQIHGGTGEVDGEYWAQAAAANMGHDDDDGDDGPAIPFDTQFFQDDEADMPDFQDDDVDMDVGNVGGNDGSPAGMTEDDVLAATQGKSAKRARPDFVQYAKKAKRVDVKRLKENIWRELDVASVNHSTNTNDDVPVKSFDTVVDGLRKVYPPDKMSELSTSFCFICLLHLANEQGLKINTNLPPPLEVDDNLVGQAGSAVASLVRLTVNKEQV